MRSDNGGDAREGPGTAEGVGTDHLWVVALTLLMGGSVIALVGQYTAAQAGPAIVLSLLLAALGALLVLACLRMAMRRTPAARDLLGLLEAACGPRLALALGALLLLELLATVAGVALSGARHLQAAIATSGIAHGHWPEPRLMASAGLLLVAGATLLRPRPALLLACALLTMKIGVGLLVLLLAARHVHYAHWIPWLPSATAPYRFGVGGVLVATVPLLGVFASAGLMLGFSGLVPRPRAQATAAAAGAVLVAMLWLMLMAALQSGLVEFAALASTRPLSVALQGVPQLQWLLPLLPAAGWAGLAALQLVLLLLGVRLLPALLRHAGSGYRPIVRCPVLGPRLIVWLPLLMVWLPEGWLPTLPGPAGLLVLAAVCVGVLRHRRTGIGAVRPARMHAELLLASLATLLCLLPVLHARWSPVLAAALLLPLLCRRRRPGAR